MRWTWRQAVSRRMSRHFLTVPVAASAPAAIPAAAAAICGVHAQIASAAELQLGVRMPVITRTDVRRALWTDRSLVKTYGPRGTVHWLPAADLAIWNGALSAIPARSGLPESARLSAAQSAEVIRAIADALDRGAPTLEVPVGPVLDSACLTLDELDSEVVRRTGPWAADPVVPMFGGMAPRWRQAIAAASYTGVLVFGPNRGPKTTFTRAPVSSLIDETGPEPEVELLRRYLHAYGPASPRDFAQWLAAPLAWASDVFEGARLEPVSLEGTEVWLNAGDAEPVDPPARGVRLLPYFDPYVVGSQPRSLVYPGRASERALGRGQAGVLPVLLVDGVVAGVWHQRRAGRRIVVTVESFSPLRARQLAQLEPEAHRIGEILEGDAELTIGDVAVRAHA
ncbi:winged helix DNA-binding domain-containing protein [Lacisediminihabitans profunda]|uniref:Winged helix DNA-binding domain-containing protein n=1 Tax=Lacisediminihabitans profunda TaxID=2594790 RepID=A0A5C8UWA9_9MICO|nr:winged helix DNA-binding domain-containing protein [Lacisediminihabitans profunda]TXN31948.1 winged helix DNA-binding domain-containing protein [Lacisediminihabitans profunda]